jgi:hypothetical protein
MIPVYFFHQHLRIMGLSLVGLPHLLPSKNLHYLRHSTVVTSRGGSVDDLLHLPATWKEKKKHMNSLKDSF